MEIHAQIGRKIRAIRRGRLPEMSIETLAERSGLSRQTIGAIETGKNKKVAISTIDAIARALGVPLVALLPGQANAAGMAAEAQAGYSTTGDASSHHVAGGTAGQKPRMVHHKRRAG